MRKQNETEENTPMKATILLGIIVFVGASAFAQTDQLPPESQELLQKLKEWELEKQIELKKEFEEKRRTVATVLKQHVTAATKRGDLDSAIAIQKQIDALTGGETLKVSSSTPVVKKSKPARIKCDLRFEPFRSGRKVFTNKPAVWMTIPEDYAGHYFFMAPADEKKDVHFEVIV